MTDPVSLVKIVKQIEPNWKEIVIIKLSATISCQLRIMTKVIISFSFAFF